MWRKTCFFANSLRICKLIFYSKGFITCLIKCISRLSMCVWTTLSTYQHQFIVPYTSANNIFHTMNMQSSLISNINIKEEINWTINYKISITIFISFTCQILIFLLINKTIIAAAQTSIINSCYVFLNL